MYIDEKNLLLSAQRALLFSITSITRLIFLEQSGDTLKVWVYVENEPSEDELDFFYSIAGEICGDFVELIDSNVEVFVTDFKYDDVKKLKYLIYAKAE